jgi:hypothetical protein
MDGPVWQEATDVNAHDLERHVSGLLSAAT